ncbi:hypothetical protein PG997_009476 [Apiospora hydei]|uniref:Uncharacterized protein n=1 Tax=Apiospora hydei TaxID=1337664 RepID=A0ABR1VU93_9PEZI
MEPPAKRHKVGQPPPRDDPHNEANDDELTLSTSWIRAEQRPSSSSSPASIRKGLRWRGDEINLHTGEVIINNGHLQSLEDEQDKEDLSADEEEEERILQNKNPSSTSTSFTSGHSTPNNAALQLQSNWFSRLIDNTSAPLWDAAPFAAFGPAPVDPMWQTPELQMGGPQGHLGLFGNAYLGQMNPFQSGYGGGIGRLLNRGVPRRIATAAELAVRSRQDAFLGEELAEEEGSDENGLSGVSKEGGRPKQLPLDSSKQKAQERNSIPSATTSKGYFPKDDPIKKGGATTTENVLSESIRKPRASDKTLVEDVTSAGSLESQAQQEEHSVSRNKAVQPVEITDDSHAPKHSSSFVIELQSAPGGVIPQKQLIAKKIRREERSQGVEEDITEGSQGRRSGRPRVKPEFYGNVSWLKTRRPKPDMETLLDSDPNGEDHTPFEESEDLPDVDMAFADAPNYENPMTEEAILDTSEDLQPGDVGNKAFIEAAESIFLSRSNDATESPELAPESIFDRPSELQLPAPVGSEPTKAIQQGESFFRNHIDPSYNFSDDEDEFDGPELPKSPAEGLGLASHNCNNGIVTVPEAEESIEIPAIQDEEVQPVESPSTTTTVETSKFSRIPVSEANHGETDEENAQTTSPEILVDRTAIAADSASDRGASLREQERDSSGHTAAQEVLHDSSPPPGPELPPSPSLSRSIAKPRRPLAKPAAASPRTPKKKTKKRSLNDDSASGQGDKTKTTKSTATTSETKRLTSSAKRHALASLIPDNSDDEDEISILAHTPTSSRHAEAPFSSSPLRNNTGEPFTPSHRGARNRSSLGSSVAAARRTESRYAPATDSRALAGHSSSAARRRSSKADYRSTAAKTKTTAFSSPLLQRVLKTPRTVRRYHHPSFTEEEGLVRTPGGTMRRCGVDGFVCDRDFCLTCCK